jgi:hypothetical protein
MTGAREAPRALDKYSTKITPTPVATPVSPLGSYHRWEAGELLLYKLGIRTAEAVLGFHDRERTR